MKLDRGDKILIFIIGFMFFTLLLTSIFRQAKISKANIEIETTDYIYYSTKESLRINPNNLCISFYNIVKEYDIEHCGTYTINYIK